MVSGNPLLSTRSGVLAVAAFKRSPLEVSDMGAVGYLGTWLQLVAVTVASGLLVFAPVGCRATDLAGPAARLGPDGLQYVVAGTACTVPPSYAPAPAVLAVGAGLVALDTWVLSRPAPP